MKRLKNMIIGLGVLVLIGIFGVIGMSDGGAPKGWETVLSCCDEGTVDCLKSDISVDGCCCANC